SSPLVYRIFQGLASLERRCLAGSDLDGLARLWIVARARGTLTHHEAAETNKRDLIALLQGVGNATKHGINRAPCFGFRKTRFLGDDLDQFCLVHGFDSPLYQAWIKSAEPSEAYPDFSRRRT